MISTLKPTDTLAAQQEAARHVSQDAPSVVSGSVRSAFHQQPADMRGNSDLSVAGADFSTGTLTGTSGSSSSTSYAERLQIASAWFDAACQAQVGEADRRMARGADRHSTSESGCVDLMDHALAIAKVLKIEMPGFMTALLRPALADTARKFAREVAQGLDQYVTHVERGRPSYADSSKSDYFAATSALRSDSPDLNGIWSRNPLFAMNHLDDKAMLLAKIEQYTAKHQEALAV